MALQTRTEHSHSAHPHVHGPNCGHARVQHDGHQDYLHDGHLRFQDGSKVRSTRSP